MDLWKSAMQVAEKAKSVAKVVSQKGMVRCQAGHGRVPLEGAAGAI